MNATVSATAQSLASQMIDPWRRVRAPLTVAEALRAGISGSRLVVLPDAGHVCNVEAPDEFNAAVRDFLRETRS